MPLDILELIRDGAISLKDIEDFSSDLQETIKFLLER